MPVIILEGCDKCGKSTFIKNLDIKSFEFKDIKDKPYTYHTLAIHSKFGDDDKDILNYALHLSNLGITVFLDRSWISEAIYGAIYRNKMISTEDETYFLNQCIKNKIQVLHFVRRWENILKELDFKDIFEQDIQKMRQAYDTYNEYIEVLKDMHLSVYRISFEE